jgi:3-oxoacyl-[acyl-carrier protein] reductase
VTDLAKVCVVAGASSGIGRACAEHLDQNGWQVFGLSRRRPTDWPAHRSYVEIDLVEALDSDPSAVRKVLRDAGALPRHGRFAVVHAVGDIYDGVPDAGPSWDRWRTSLDLCLGTAVTLAQATFEELRVTAGSLVLVSSVAAAKPYPGIPDYCAAKAALNSYMRSVARELAATGGRANCVSPAVVDTPLFHKGPYTVEQAAQWHALGRIGRPEEIAAMVGFLAGDDARWITGQEINLDGGMAL